ncbi:MAG: CPBP family intramembrane metalloprotease [Planctomycetes bacterium]|nr:CPBP family intramembrane metalloprotease [Planctomycetota bacterium]
MAAIAAAWLCGVGAFVLVRLRGTWPSYVALHRWLADLGVPPAVRNLDSLVLQLSAAALGAWLGGRLLQQPPRHLIGLRRGRPGWRRAALLGGAPLLLGGLGLGLAAGGPWSDDWLAKAWSGWVRAPLVEELLCRGLLVGVTAAALGPQHRGRLAAVLGNAAVFALLHVEWSLDGIATGWPTLLVTGLGGLWYAWLLLRWQTLWVPILLHAMMNAGWQLAGATGGAGGGGLWPNLLRAGTIALATWLTVRGTRRAPRNGSGSPG